MLTNEKMLGFIENYNCAFIVGNFIEGCVTYTNPAAEKLYGVNTDTADLEPIFAKNKSKLYDMFLHDMKNSGKDNVLVNDVVTLLADGSTQVADVHLGYFDQKGGEIYVEIMPKQVNQMDIMCSLVENMSKPTVVLNMNCSIVYCNQLADRLFGIEKGATICRLFLPEYKEAVVKETEIALKKETNFHLEQPLLTADGETVWFSLDFQRENVGESGEHMICVFHSIQDRKNTEYELESISDYFNVVESLTNGLLYRLDVKRRVLYRNKKTAEFYGVAEKAEHYPEVDNLKGVFHPDDIDEYIQYIETVYKGIEGSHVARLMAPSRKFEYHRITFKRLEDSDGTLREMVGNAVNVQYLKETEEKLSSVNEYFAIMQSLSKDLLYRLDIKNKILYRNSETSSFYGIPPVVENYPNTESLTGVFHPDDIHNYVDYIHSVMAGEEGTHTARLISPSGNFEYHKFTFKKLTNPDGTIKEMVGNAVNVQDLMALETKATYDMLTNTLNKISFQEQTSHILAHSTVKDRHALFFIDLDDFKGINDNLGHPFGDFLLQTVGGRLKKLVREGDIVGRVGGDEFVVFMEACGDDLHLEKRAIAMLEALREEYLQNSTRATIKGSVGVSIYPIHGTTYEELYENADKALYFSKNLGKDVATIYYNGLSEE